MKRSLFVVILILFATTAYPQTSFYQGKTVRIIVGTPPGNLYDLWARLIVAHMGKHIPGNPDFIVQNMPGAGHVVAVNHLFSVAKPDGLTLIGSVIPSLYLNQLIGRKEIQFDWAKFTWIGSPARGESQMYMRSDTPYKTIEDVRTAKEPPKCGATGVTGPDSYLPKLLQEIFGAKFNIVTGYPGGTDIDLAVERGEIHCRAFTIEAFFGREPYHTWRKKGFVRNLFQTGKKRDPRLGETPTVFELMDQYKTNEAGRRLAAVLLAADSMGRPMFGPPGVPADRLKILREAFAKTMNDPQFQEEVKKRNYEFDPVSGEELEKMAKDVTSQPPEIIGRLTSVLGN
ncbi:MAG TPA: tripartite tricarboxylate transporter substrate-binding protein [Candidatus Binatia bacterium]|jgi:tripartite-type tricarboxylate transporter receptor subunit TctC|nr:tripartite tricarboxylate transporter substrate-binding protein [Candidatus Binatia bacterium]